MKFIQTMPICYGALKTITGCIGIFLVIFDNVKIADKELVKKKHQERERQSEAILQTELNAQIEPQPLPQPSPPPPPQSQPQPPPEPPLVDPLTGSAVTPEERTQLLIVREKLMAIKREKCGKCMENWLSDKVFVPSAERIVNTRIQIKCILA
jgi:hypothetical protein